MPSIVTIQYSIREGIIMSTKKQSQIFNESNNAKQSQLIGSVGAAAVQALRPMEEKTQCEKQSQSVRLAE